MHVLVTAASKHGSTAVIARALADALLEQGVTATALPPEEVADLAAYDAVVIGSAVYAGRWVDAARAFVAAHRDALRVRPVWLFSSGPVGDPPKPEGDPADIADLLMEVDARDHRVFAGKLDKRALGLGERAVVKVVRAPEGDFRDWDAITDWAAEIATALKPRLTPA